MLNLNVSVNDIGSPLSAGVEKNSLELEKTTDSTKLPPPFQQLMVELLAQADAADNQSTAQATVGSALQGLAGGKLRQDDAAPTSSLVLTPERPGTSMDALQASVVLNAPISAVPAVSIESPKWSPIEFLTQGVSDDDATKHSDAIEPAVSLVAPTTPGVTGFHAVNTLVHGSALGAESGSLQGPSSWGDWREMRVSQSLTVITRPMNGLDEGNLSDFALQQGLDASTVRWLLMQPPTTNTKSALDAIPIHSQAFSLNAHVQGGPDQPVSPVWLDLTPGLEAQWSQWLKLNHGVYPNGAGNQNDLVSAPSAESAVELQPLNDATLGGQNHGDPGQAGLSNQGHHSFQKALTEAAPSRLSLPLHSTMTGQDLADKMNQAIGKRLLEAIEKGDWQLKINLKPAELGHIEVELRMRDNALEAKFTASQMMARDLLESGLGRLKETLQQSGTDVASIRVNDGSSSRNGGDSTPRQTPQGQQVVSTVRDDSPRMDDAPIPRNNPISDGRLDLMV